MRLIEYDAKRKINESADSTCMVCRNFIQISSKNIPGCVKGFVVNGDSVIARNNDKNTCAIKMKDFDSYTYTYKKQRYTGVYRQHTQFLIVRNHMH